MQALISLTLLCGVSDLHFRDEVGKFDGVWEVVSYQFRGVDVLAEAKNRETDPRFRSPDRFRIDGTMVYPADGDEVVGTLCIRRDGTLDLQPISVPIRELKGIYSLKDNQLRIAVFSQDDEMKPKDRRPASFDPRQDDLMIITLKKIR